MLTHIASLGFLALAAESNHSQLVCLKKNGEPGGGVVGKGVGVPQPTNQQVGKICMTKDAQKLKPSSTVTNKFGASQRLIGHVFSNVVCREKTKEINNR